MNKILMVLLIGMICLPLMGADPKKKDEIKTFDFEAADISGQKTKPAGSSVTSLLNKKTKTTIKPRENFLPELSSSVDEF